MPIPTPCPECGKSSAYYRSFTDTFRCKYCGHVWSATPGERGE